MAARDRVDGGRTRDYLVPLDQRPGCAWLPAWFRLPRIKRTDQATGLPILNRSQKRLLDRLTKAEQERVFTDDQFGTDY